QVGCLTCLSTEPSSSASSTLSLHDALPICNPGCRIRTAAEDAAGRDGAAQGVRPAACGGGIGRRVRAGAGRGGDHRAAGQLLLADRKSTRLNSSHVKISYAVFCLKKKKKQE